jgi:hypothetical protein
MLIKEYKPSSDVNITQSLMYDFNHCYSGFGSLTLLACTRNGGGTVVLARSSFYNVSHICGTHTLCSWKLRVMMKRGRKKTVHMFFFSFS